MYEAKASIWYTDCGQKIIREVKVSAPTIQGYSGLSGELCRRKREVFSDIKEEVWKAPVVEVTKNGKHYGFYYQVNSSLGRLSWTYQGFGKWARKSRLEKMQGTGYSMLFNVYASDKCKEAYKERTGKCLDELSQKLSDAVNG